MFEDGRLQAVTPSLPGQIKRFLAAAFDLHLAAALARFY